MRQYELCIQIIIIIIIKKKNLNINLDGQKGKCEKGGERDFLFYFSSFRFSLRFTEIRP